MTSFLDYNFYGIWSIDVFMPFNSVVSIISPNQNTKIHLKHDFQKQCLQAFVHFELYYFMLGSICENKSF